MTIMRAARCVLLSSSLVVAACSSGSNDGGTTEPPKPAGVSISWSAPTANTDGSPLTGADAIARYRVEWGTVNANTFGYFINSEVVNSPATSLTLTGLAPGDYAFRVVAIAVDGEESAPSITVTRTIT